MSRAPHPSPTLATVELLLQADGQILARNLTPAMAALLSELNPADEAMSQRAKLGRATSAPPQNKPDSP